MIHDGLFGGLAIEIVIEAQRRRSFRYKQDTSQCGLGFSASSPKVWFSGASEDKEEDIWESRKVRKRKEFEVKI